MAIPTNKGFQLYFKTDVPKRTLEFLLLPITPIDSVCGCRHNLATGTDTLPQSTIIELPRKHLARGVVNILHVGKNSNLIHALMHSR